MQEVKDVDFRLEAEDTLLTETIEIGKEDESSNPVEGAQFGLYAGREIRNADGEILFRKGERIMEAQSESTGKKKETTDAASTADTEHTGTGRKKRCRKISSINQVLQL